MAKTKTKPKRGQKICPNCGAMNAARQKVCTKCEKAFPVKRKSVGGRKSGKKAHGQNGSTLGHLDAGLIFIRTAGGIDQAKDILATIERIRSS